MRGYAFNRTADFETVRGIKEKLCYTRYVVYRLAACTLDWASNSSECPVYSTSMISYDLEQDKRLSEDTTVLVENYTVR